MGKKILLADDSITIQKVIELTFSDEDFEVVTVGNGRLAIERVQDVRPDIVLCDIIMPEKDGYEVCDFIKRSPALTHVPVLLLTGAFEPFDQEKAARVGSDGFLAKPFEPQTLIAKVKDLLSQAASRKAAAAPVAAPPVAPPRPMAVPPPPVPTHAAGPTTPPHGFQAPVYVPAPDPAPVAAPPAPTFQPPPAFTAPAQPAWTAPARPPAPEPVPDVEETMPMVEPEPASWAPQPAPAWTVAGRAPVAEPELPPAAPEWPADEEPVAGEVNFISDEPYSPGAFETAGGETIEAAPLEPVGDAGANTALDDDLYVPEAGTPIEELMDVAPEEAATLQSIEAADDEPAPARTWAQPTMEVSLEDRAQAGVAHVEGERMVFEEVFEEEARPAAWTAAPPPAPEPMPPTPVDFEPEFGAGDDAAHSHAGPSFEPEFQDADRTVMFTVGEVAAATPGAYAPPSAPEDRPDADIPTIPPMSSTFAPRAVPPPPPPAPPKVEPPAPRFDVPTRFDAPAPRFDAPAPRFDAPTTRFDAPVPMPLEPTFEAEPDTEPEPEPAPSFSDLASVPEPAALVPVYSAAADVPVPVDMVSQIAQRVIAQISDKVVREIAWEVIPDLAEALIRKEIERLKAELQKT
jgi:CheY-like chemotaxis protein